MKGGTGIYPVQNYEKNFDEEGIYSAFSCNYCFRTYYGNFCNLKFSVH